ncbi:MAG TPA: glycerol dehydrogenase [Feifaniaceae bacterium]|nr:glycerol dehydrogenase [Feifaniaceae bacterium]
MSMLTRHTRGYGSPGRYFQGPGLLDALNTFTALYGNRVFAVIDGFFFDAYTEKYRALYKNFGAILTERFGGEVTEKEILRVTEVAKPFAPDVIVGIGGGKTLDTAKAAADNFHAPVIIAPTTASTDAPCSALSVIYKENGEHSHARHYVGSPNIVLMDSAVIAKAPIRYLIAGMGDALTTYFEAKANEASDSPNYISGGYRRPKAAMAIAELCYKILLEDGLKAKLAAEQGLVTEAVENIIEANTLLSGLGFENTGCAGAHSVGDGITGLKEGATTLHGERCAFGVICQLIAEGGTAAELEEVLRFNISVGLPVTLEDLGVPNTEENLKTIAEVSLHSFWDAEPFQISVPEIMQAVKAADSLGRYYQKNRAL